MSTNKKITTKAAEILLEDDGIIRIAAFGEMHSIEDAKEVTAAVSQITGNKRYPVLIDSTNVKDMSPEGRAYYTSEEAFMSVSAIAIMIKSGISKLMTNFFIDMSRLPGPPRKLFDDENKAVLWLKNYIVSGAAVTRDMDEINILIYEPISQMQKPIVYTLINNGIKCLCLKEKKEIINKLRSKKYNVFICSIAPGTKDTIDIIKEIKQIESLNFIKIILWSPPSSKEYFEEMIKLGIKGVILKPFVNETFENNLFKLLFQDNLKPDRRQNIRVEPGDDDRIIVAIRSSSTHKTIVGKLKSLSMNGLVLELTENISEDDLKENDEITNNNIKITINDNDISTNGLIHARIQNIVVIRFSEMQDYYKNMLSSYIYKRINF